ncbi:MAG: ECF transporter S component [Spirochaetota bacterium]
MNSSKKITLFEIVLIAVLSVVIGVAFWGWTYVYEQFKPFLKPFGFKYLLAGFWLLSGVLLPYIIRKPLVAIVSETISGLVEGFITRWGLLAGVWGFVQGLGCEIVFLIFGYKKWKLGHLILASIVSAIASYLLDFFYEPYYNLALRFNLFQLISFIISSILFTGLLSYFLGNSLAKTGVLNHFDIVKDQNQQD